MGREAKTMNLSSDGITIKSYGLTIGFNLKGETYAIDYTSTGGHYRSQTTSTHVNALKREGGVKCISVEEWELMFSKLLM